MMSAGLPSRIWCSLIMKAGLERTDNSVQIYQEKEIESDASKMEMENTNEGLASMFTFLGDLPPQVRLVDVLFGL